VQTVVSLEMVHALAQVDVLNAHLMALPAHLAALAMDSMLITHHALNAKTVHQEVDKHLVAAAVVAHLVHQTAPYALHAAQTTAL
jgi:hypothetical protein